MIRTAAAIFSLFAASAFAQEKPKQEGENFYRDCKLGDWIEAKGHNGVIMKHSVVAKSDESLTIKIDQTIPGIESKPIEYKVDLSKPYPPPREKSDDFEYTSTQEKLDSGKETLTIGGKKYECEWEKTKHTTVTKFQGKEMKSVTVTKSWRCKDVPLGWPVRTESELEGGIKSSMEIVDYGHGK